MGIDIVFGEGTGRRPIDIFKRKEAREDIKTPDDPDDKIYRSSPDEGSKKTGIHERTEQNVQECENIVHTVWTVNSLITEKFLSGFRTIRTILGRSTHEETVRQKPPNNSGLYDADDDLPTVHIFDDFDNSGVVSKRPEIRGNGHPGLMRVLSEACAGLSITPDELLAELSPEDHTDVVADARLARQYAASVAARRELGGA